MLQEAGDQRSGEIQANGDAFQCTCFSIALMLDAGKADQPL